MASNFIDPKRPGVLNLSFILFFFKALVVLLFLGVLLQVPTQVNEKRDELQSDISGAHLDIVELNKQINKCDNPASKKTKSSGICKDERDELKLQTATVAKSKKELGEFKNQYYAMVVWLPGFIAACLMLIGRYVGSASLVAFINLGLIALVPDLSAVPLGHTPFGFVSIFILLAFLGHRYSLYLVLDEPTQKTKEKTNESPSE